MSMKLGVVMDPIQYINFKKDSTLAMLWEAQVRGWEIYYFEQPDLFLKAGKAFGFGRTLKLFHDPNHFFEFTNERTIISLNDLNIILMRKDPPFNEEYIYTTYILEQAELSGTLVVNKAQSLRDCNEKIFTTQFPECMPPTLVTASIQNLHEFWREHKDIICKPLNTMGGTLVYRLRDNDANANVIFSSLTDNGTCYTMAQKFIPEITQGDKRIILINGEPVAHCLARIPQGNDWRGNLAAGAKGVVQELTHHDHEICKRIGPELRSRGLYFVGIDVIGNYLTEINVTSPTCIREIDAATGGNISATLMDCIEQQL